MKWRSLGQYFIVLGNPIFLHFPHILINLSEFVSKLSSNGNESFKTFGNSVLIFTYKFKNANGMFQRNSNNLFIVLLITEYNIMQDIDNRSPPLDANRIFIF
ncbi:hypothetical protein T11_7134, partial [Trichinella zimbabwensis]